MSREINDFLRALNGCLRKYFRTKCRGPDNKEQWLMITIYTQL